MQNILIELQMSRQHQEDIATTKKHEQAQLNTQFNKIHIYH